MASLVPSLPSYEPSWLHTPAIQSTRKIDGWSVSVSRGTQVVVPIKAYTANSVLSINFDCSFDFPFQVDFVTNISEKAGVGGGSSSSSSSSSSGESKEPTAVVLHKKIAAKSASLSKLLAPSTGYFLLSFNNKGSWMTTLAVSNLSWTLENDTDAPCYAIGSLLVNPVPANPRDMKLTMVEAKCLTLVRCFVANDVDLLNEPMCCGVPLVHDTDVLLRFTRARDSDPPKVMDMLRKHVVWRRSSLPIQQQDIEEEIPKKRVYVHGKSQTNHHLVVVRCYRILNEGYDPNVLVNLQLDLVRQFEEMDRMESWNDRGTRHPATYSTIVDTTGIKKPPTDYLQKLSEIFGDNYPERSWKTVIAPVPGFVRLLVNGMLWFIDPVTRSKISICSSNEQAAEGAEVDLNVMEKIMNESLEFKGKLIGDDYDENDKKGGEEEEEEDGATMTQGESGDESSTVEL